MALGAGRRSAVTFVVRRVLRPVVVGLIAGLGIAVAAVRVLGSILYGVSPFDPLAFTAAIGILAAAAVGAAWLPARRAAAVDPMLALRSE
jgi:ABC-type antimicrobial peptide transport system permease subunit